MHLTRDFFFVIALQFISVRGEADYCAKDLQCTIDDKTIANSGCKCPAKDPKCEKKKITKLSDDSLEDHVVQLHNFYRNKIASGDEKRSGNIGATDMMEMAYDDDLEYTAWCYGHKCPEEPDKCPITVKFKSNDTQVNQLLMRFPLMTCRMDTLDIIVDMFYEQVAQMKDGVKTITKHKDAPSIRGFTQLVWAKTTHLGCAHVQDNSDSPSCLLVCNYGPAGNRDEMRVYTLGPPQRDCVEKSKTYTSLCIGPVGISGDPVISAGLTTVDSFALALDTFFTIVCIFII